MLIAKIREDACIGCSKCILACPVDAIVGTQKLMHGVLTEECIGCQLCVAPCPVDCIEMVQLSEDPDVSRGTKAKQRYIARRNRLLKKQKPLLVDYNQDPEFKMKVQREIESAVARVRVKRNEQGSEQKNEQQKDIGNI